MKRNKILLGLLLGVVLTITGCGGTDDSTEPSSTDEAQEVAADVEEESVAMVDITYGLPSAGVAALLGPEGQTDRPVTGAQDTNQEQLSTESADGQVNQSAIGQEDTSIDSDSTDQPLSSTPQKGVIRVATVGNPNLEMLELADSLLEKMGYRLEITVCQDYDSPNVLLTEGKADVNFYQHTAFLERYNKEKGTDIEVLTAIHYEPMGIYPGEVKSLEEVPQGARIGVPANSTAYARSLYFLEQLGFIELAQDADLRAVWDDVVNNPLDLELIKYEEEELAALSEEVDLTILHAGSRLWQGKDPADCLALETRDSMPVSMLAQILAVREGIEVDGIVQEDSQISDGEDTAKEAKDEEESSADESANNGLPQENSSEDESAKDSETTGEGQSEEENVDNGTTEDQQEGALEQNLEEGLAALIRVLKSDEMKEFAEKKYQGSILILE